jgi:antitoxin (DNA-binding transcriptional repressor) of toxin-antitoxin stability system
MDETLTLSEAKEQLEEVVARAARGETVRIVHPQLGAVKVVADTMPKRPKRVIGQWKGRIEVPARLMEPLSEDELRWLSGEEAP